MRELLTPEQMGACDRFTIADGTAGTTLMERAGKAVADAAKTMLGTSGRVLVLAGPGNNGGDGYVAARLLAEDGYDVQVAALGDTSKLSGDARWAFERWGGRAPPAEALTAEGLTTLDLIVDALFGAGLARPLDGEAAFLVEAVRESERPVLAVDLPSGVDGLTGLALGPAIKANSTITFHRIKPGHVFHPGRTLCGAIHVADIGIDPEAIGSAGYAAQLTGHYLADNLQALTADGHKYGRGHALMVAGPPDKAGAGFLAASAALRAGAGLVTLAAPPTTLAGSIGQFPALMRAPCADANDLARLLSDGRLTACALGPGLPPDEATRQMVYAAIASKAALVLDAGALTAFAGTAEMLFARIKARTAPTILTPHTGEFARLFGASSPALSKIDSAHQAAQESGAVVVLKGADTVMAHPNGQASCTYVNANAPPSLATAGSGDVLTGIVTGLLAQHGSHERDETVTALVALAVWLHGRAGQKAGPSLVASDLEPALRDVLNALRENPFSPLET